MNYNIDPNSRKEKLKKYARDLRKHMTPGEVRTWALLKEFPLNFNRQFIIGEYIVDFVCRELKLVIEIDGISHDQGKGLYDIYREKEITKLGWTVIRFREEYIMTEFKSYKDSLGETLVYYMEKIIFLFMIGLKIKKKILSIPLLENSPTLIFNGLPFLRETTQITYLDLKLGTIIINYKN